MSLVCVYTIYPSTHFKPLFGAVSAVAMEKASVEISSPISSGVLFCKVKGILCVSFYFEFLRL